MAHIPRRPKDEASWNAGSGVPLRVLDAGAIGTLARVTLAPAVWPTDCPDLPRRSSSAEELIVAIGLESGDPDPSWHLDALKNFPGLRIDSPQITVIAFPSGVPELSIDPRDAGDKAVGLDRAKNRASLGIDLMDSSVPILPDP